MKHCKTNTFILHVLLLGLVFLFFECTSENEANNPDSIVTPNVEKASEGSLAKAAINPNRPYYDVVIMDADRWEICLNLVRLRQHVNSYSGHLWYQAGSFIFEGHATAVYNHQLDHLTVTALDSGWDRGHIAYGLQFIEGTNDMYGSYVYREFPRRTNGINAWLVQGQLGPHIYGLTAKCAEPLPGGHAPLEHPKKARLEQQDNK